MDPQILSEKLEALRRITHEGLEDFRRYAAAMARLTTTQAD